MHCVPTTDHTASPPEAGSSRPALFTRLHALLPQGPLSAHLSGDGNNATSTSPSQASPPRQQTCLKVRIVTWNMHESLPKGNLQELLGQVPTYTAPVEQHPSVGLPHLSNDSEHAYHLIVIAGQECPSLSGMPLGLGAGFKIGSGDKEKEKDRDRDKDKDNKDKDRDRDNDEQEPSEPLIEKRLPKFEQRDDELVPHTSGWTSILEDFFVHGLPVVGPSARAKDKSPHHELGRSLSTGDMGRRSKTGTKGPYEMLVKERMMGIYLAIFVHRDAKHLVRGTSKSAVTAGLIGGRVGNKGAVGISLKIGDTTMLFVNAHLTAHESKVPHRLANLAKIKNELAVDDFLKADDPRTVAEDITDRFDFTFLFGDLNFRLDLSRLHADWLISRREYAQALAFDQLYNIMRNGQAFVGFREAAINFPPTFKYDVLRTIRHKRKRSKHSQTAMGVVTPPSRDPTEAGDQPEVEEHHDGGHSDGSSEDDVNGELASVISSGTTTFSQRDPMSDEDNDSDAESDYLRRRMAYPQTSGGLVKRISMSAAQRAKSKWAELVHAPSSPRIIRSRRTNAPTPQLRGDGKSPRSIPTTPLLGQRATPSPDNPSDGVLASVSSIKGRGRSSLSITGDGTAETEDDKGVYDSSSKRRVPSWCDRILFKSTVKPDPEPEDDSHAAPQRTAVSLIAQAWRSFRRTSSNSLRSVSTAPSASALSATTTTSFPSAPPSAADPESDAARFLPTPYVPRRKRQRPRSIDVGALPSTTSHPPLFSTTYRPATSVSAQAHRLPDAKGTNRGDASSNALLPTRALTEPSTPAVTPDQHEPLLTARTPSSSLASGTTITSSSAASSGGSGGGGSGGGGGGLRGQPHPRWRRIPFLLRDAEATRDAAEAAAALATATADADAEPATRMTATAATPPSSLPGGGLDRASGAAAGPAESSSRPRKGDVVCLSYRTLDDRGMRRLEGRSDHRPVIGVYAIYV